ncbi:hypothetical protein FSP39_015722 [Pinctada imbricata]|uniref:SCP domain-containing protein n=1 Tax=Pinctada imbricata TaxID=66713 RepID=A0AA88Y0D7_PINIB|nr:hypothetical protein FSP39_015722 [Pinctada imbricata]
MGMCGSTNGGSAPPQSQTQNQVNNAGSTGGDQQREEQQKEEERRKQEEAKRLEEERQRKLEEEERQRKVEEEERQRKLEEEERLRKLKEEEEKRKAQEEQERRRRVEEEERKRKEEEQNEDTTQSNAAVASAGLDFVFIEAAIEEQNRYRSLHGTPPLTHSVVLSNYAQKWAEELSKRDSFAHSNCTLDDGTRVGENLAVGFTGTGIEMPAKNAVQMWYDEIKDYEKFFGGEPDMKEFMQFGHFTQIVWKETKEVGIGKILKDGKTIIVGTYLPPGNLVGSFKDNVSPPV